jgi:hypothetical protein
MLKLSIQCTRFKSNYSSCTGRSSENIYSSTGGKSSENIYVAIMEALRKKERGDETQFTTKIGGKLVWVPVISFCKISFPVMHLLPYYA